MDENEGRALAATQEARAARQRRTIVVVMAVVAGALSVGLALLRVMS